MPSNIDTLLPDSLWMFAGDLVPNLSCRLSTRKEVKGQGGVRNDSFFHKHICCLEAMQIPFSASREWGQEVGNGRGMIEKRKRTGRGECGEQTGRLGTLLWNTRTMRRNPFYWR